MSEISVLEVRLGDVLVGWLRRSAGGSDLTTFRFAKSYRDLSPWPVLGQCFLDDLDKIWSAKLRLPAFFSNLLPDLESPLRKAFCEQFKMSPEREFSLLEKLGEDLPGNVVVRASQEDALDSLNDEGSPGEIAEEVREELNSALRFSLAGMQLKLSMQRDGRSLTVPAHGRGGDWIVKLPDRGYANVPENEWSMMRWAQAASIAVPEFELIDGHLLSNVPHGFLHDPGALCYAVRRFDRATPQRRIHMEDFAQVLAVYDRGKYTQSNFETVGRILHRVGGEADLREYVRRLVFVVLSGNADAHLKNWSLLYPDGVRAQLSPAYDLVSTILYPELGRQLAMNFNRSSSFANVSLFGFRRFARKLDRDQEEMVRWVREDVARIRDAWASLSPELPLSKDAKAEIGAHQQSLRLCAE